MNCQTAIRAIALATTGDLPPESAEVLASHLLICGRCRSEEKVAALITAALKTPREPAPAGDFTAQVLDRIRNAGETAPRERAWMPLVPAAALLLSIGAVWMTSFMTSWWETATALGSHLLLPFAGPAVPAPFAAIPLVLLVASVGALAFAAREFAAFMRE
jgi:anti-sigma factor RsiW